MIRACRAVACVLAVCTGSLACGGKQAHAPGPDAGCNVFDAGPLDPTLVGQGLTLVVANQCQQCHGTILAGNFDGVQIPLSSLTQYPPNLTPDPATGLGCWTNAQIENAILNSVDNQGAALCGPMPHFSAVGLSQSDAEAIVAYLRSLYPVSNNVPSGPDCSCTADPDCPSGETCLNGSCTCLTLACALQGVSGGGSGTGTTGGGTGGSTGGTSGGATGGSSGGTRGTSGGTTGTTSGGGPGDGGKPDSGLEDGGATDSGMDGGRLDGGGDGGAVDAGLADGGFDAGQDSGVDGGEASDGGVADAN